MSGCDLRDLWTDLDLLKSFALLHTQSFLQLLNRRVLVIYHVLELGDGCFVFPRKKDKDNFLNFTLFGNVNGESSRIQDQNMFNSLALNLESLCSKPR